MTKLRVHIAVLAAADGAAATGGISDVVRDRATAAGHTVVARAVVANEAVAIAGQLTAWIADPNIDIVIATAVDGKTLHDEVARLGVPREVATAVPAAGVRLFRCDATVVFVVPGTRAAVGDAMDRVVKPQLDLQSAEARQAPTSAPTSALAPAPPAEKRVSKPPPLPAAENLVSTAEIVAIADAPPPSPPALVEKRVSTPPPLRVAENVVSTSEIVAISDAPVPRRTQPPPLRPRGSEDRSGRSGVTYAPRRQSRRLWRLIAVALFAGASGFAIAAWMLRGGSSRSSAAIARANEPPLPTAVAIDLPPPDAAIPEVTVEVSGTRDLRPTSKPPSQTASVAIDPTPHSLAGSAARSGPAGTIDPTPHSLAGSAARSGPAGTIDPTPHSLAGSATAGVRSTPDEGARKISVDSSCPEEKCVLERYAQPCCARYKPATTGEVPQGLARWMVKAAVEQVKPRVVACGEKYAATGTVNVAVKVDPDGSVVEAAVAQSPNADLGACVEAALRSGKFAKTATGGTFRYPFVF